MRLLWKYPPQLFVDEHENSSSSYFFPPTADPIYHETPDGPLRADRGHVRSGQRARRSRPTAGASRPGRSGYDFFAQVYGDTVPTTQMGAVGMTFEQGDTTPYPARVRHHYTSALATLYAGATHHTRVLRTWRRTFVQAKAQGERLPPGAEPDLQPGTRAPASRARRGRSAATSCSGNSRATRLVVSRLQDAHVVVRPAGPSRPWSGTTARTATSRASKTLPAGTYWITLAQAQKHWVQAALNEDTYVPFPYFYDVSGWSLPLLAGIAGRLDRPAGARSGGPRPDSCASPPTPSPSGPVPRIAVLDQFKRTPNDYQYTGWLKWRLARGLAVPLPGAAARAGHRRALRKFDVLVVGNVDSTPVYRRLGTPGAPRWRTGSTRAAGTSGGRRAPCSRRPSASRRSAWGRREASRPGR